MNRFSRHGLSFDERRKRRKRISRFILFLVIFLFLYILITGFLIESWVLRGRAMLPGFPPGTRFIVMPWFNVKSFSPKRGQLVVLRPAYTPPRNIFIRLLDPVLRIFTLQRLSLLGGHLASWENERAFKRIIGLPGDRIRMENFTAYIREPDSTRFLSEFELGASYQINKNPSVKSTLFGYPLSGQFETRKLAPDEYFVLGDNRVASNDSRYRGPIKESSIKGRVLLFYWPVSLFGPPALR